MRSAGSWFTAWAPALVLAGLAYAGVLVVGDTRGWPDNPTLALGAGAFVLSLATVGRRLERVGWTRAAGVRPTDVLADLQPRLAAGGDAPSALTALADGLRDATGAHAVVITTARHERDPVTVGSAEGPALRIGLRTGRRRIGELTIHADAPVLRRTVDPLGQALSGLVGASVLLAERNADLESLRARTLTTRREEQELLHRELGGTLAPELDDAVSELERADALAEVDQAAARDLVGAARRRLARSATDVRALARALLPAALDRGDLADALAQLTSTAGGASWRVHTQGCAAMNAQAQLACYLVAADMVGATESAATGVQLVLTVRADGAAPRMLVTAPGRGLAPSLHRDLRAAVERRARSLALGVLEHPDGSLEIEVPAW